MDQHGDNSEHFTVDDDADTQVSDDSVLATVRMHDQMLNCLDFVIEKTKQLHGETEVQLLRHSRARLASKRETALRSLGQR